MDVGEWTKGFPQSFANRICIVLGVAIARGGSLGWNFRGLRAIEGFAITRVFVVIILEVFRGYLTFLWQKLPPLLHTLRGI